MGVERAVTRWYLQRQSLLDQITALEAKLAMNAAPREQKQELANDSRQAEADAIQQLANFQEKLRSLGPCPKPMMG